MNSMQGASLAMELANLDRKVNALLPSRYQHCYASVSPNSMGSAGLKYGPDGKVAWEQIWTTFCDLALAGGPPHRGKLLEPVSEVEFAAGLESLGAVVREIDRAIGLTTGLPVIPGDQPGWVGVQCQSSEEAAWLQFAVTAENVSVRRRQAILQLPAGPAFRVEKEIKNVVVAVAKAYHYWDGHLTTTQQSLAGDDVWEAATPTEAAANPSDYEAVIVEVENGLREAEIPDFSSTICRLGRRRDGKRGANDLDPQGGSGREGTRPSRRESHLPSGRCNSEPRKSGPSRPGIPPSLAFMERLLAESPRLVSLRRTPTSSPPA